MSTARQPALTNAFRSSRRAYSTEGSTSQGGGLWSPLFTVLLVFGVAATGYGLYVYFPTSYMASGIDERMLDMNYMVH